MDRDLLALDRIFKALADPTRVRILGLLLSGEVCVCHIHESLNIPQPKASRHLAYLRRSGLVDTRRGGQWVYYRLAPLPDATTGAIVGAVRHALTHIDVVHRDGRRLQKKTGCCPPSPADVTGVLCCADRTATLADGR